MTTQLAAIPSPTLAELRAEVLRTHKATDKARALYYALAIPAAQYPAPMIAQARTAYDNAAWSQANAIRAYDAHPDAPRGCTYDE